MSSTNTMNKSMKFKKSSTKNEYNRKRSELINNEKEVLMFIGYHFIQFSQNLSYKKYILTKK